MNRNYFIWILSLLLTVGMLSACHEKKEEVIVEEEADSDHTLLIYMVGDNSLSGYCKDNTQNSIKGILNSPKPINLVIYEDSKVSGDGRKGKPVLFRLKRNAVNKQKVDTLYIKKYDEDWNSASIDVMQQVINEVFAQYDTPVKGLELWSHALGWVPSNAYMLSRPTSGEFETRSSQWFGMDDSREMDIWQLREALELCPHFDYIIFDACNMGQAEVAYELRGVTNYMLACPTEIMAAGLPYTSMIQSLSTCQDKQSLLPALERVVDDFAALYKDQGTFALTDLRNIADVRDAYMSLRTIYADRVKLLEEHYYTYDEEITQYGRASMSTALYFYDLIDAARFFAGADTLGASFTHLREVVGQAVIKEYHTKSFLDIRINHSCGLGVALPEAFPYTTSERILREAYTRLQWGQP